jgi:hypothetical protein
MNIVVFGATSAIGHAVCRKYAGSGANFSIIARNQEKLAIVKEDLLGRGALSVAEYIADVEDQESLASSVAAVLNTLESIDLLLITHGVLPSQQQSCSDYENFYSQFEVNFLSVVNIILALRERFEQQGSGAIAVVGSVAGDRGRKSNYAYGTAKGAVEIFLQGLRNEMFEKGVSVLTIKPGFVDTPMTADIEKGLLFASPEKVAADIMNAIEKRKEVLYTPWFWRFIMLVICSIPEKLFKRLSI